MTTFDSCHDVAFSVNQYNPTRIGVNSGLVFGDVLHSEWGTLMIYVGERYEGAMFLMPQPGMGFGTVTRVIDAGLLATLFAVNDNTVMRYSPGVDNLLACRALPLEIDQVEAAKHTGARNPIELELVMRGCVESMGGLDKEIYEAKLDRLRGYWKSQNEETKVSSDGERDWIECGCAKCQMKRLLYTLAFMMNDKRDIEVPVVDLRELAGSLVFVGYVEGERFKLALRNKE